MHARAFADRGGVVVTGVIALVVGLVLGLLAVPAQSQGQGSRGGSAPVTIVDSDNPDQGAAVDETGALKVGVGSVEIDNFPEDQNVHVTNNRSDAVPVSLAVPASEVTVNSFRLTAAPGERDEFTAEDSFQPVTMFYTSVTGTTQGELVVFEDDRGNGVMVLHGEASSGIGQEDYSISLTHLIRIGGVAMSCPSSASSDCEIFVTVTGYF
jgi:hypothetical protein